MSKKMENAEWFDTLERAAEDLGLTIQFYGKAEAEAWEVTLWRRRGDDIFGNGETFAAAAQHALAQKSGENA